MRVKRTNKFRLRPTKKQEKLLFSLCEMSAILWNKVKVKSAKRAYTDLGVIDIITAWIKGEKQCIAFSGKPLLSDWWYWTKKISKCQSQLKRVNGKNSSKRLRKLYRKRKLRFRHAVNTIIHCFVRLCYEKGVGEIVVGDVSHIRDNNDKGNKINAMIHNFWSFRYIVKRLRTTVENFGIKVKLAKKNRTSSRCPWCGSKNVRKHKKLFKCLSCGIEAHKDVVGALNIARLHGDGFNGVLAHPLASEGGGRGGGKS